MNDPLAPDSDVVIYVRPMEGEDSMQFDVSIVAANEYGVVVRFWDDGATGTNTFYPWSMVEKIEAEKDTVEEG